MNPTNDFPFSIWMTRLRDSKDNIATKLAEAGRDFFVRQFDAAQWTDRTPEQWEEVQRNIPGTSANRYNRYAGNPPLVNSGELRQALVDCIKEKRWDNIHWEVDNDYAEYHNDGTATIPKRQFMGDSYELNNILAKVLEDEIIRIVE